MVARSVISNNDYRYGFNGKEQDTENAGDYDYGFRIYDARLCRFLSVDPLMGSYPWYTPYQFAGNKPIQCVDRDGLEEVEVHSASISGEIEAMKLKGATEDEIRGFVYEKMNIMNYSTIKGAELASKHMGYGNDGKIVEIINGYSKLMIWGYKPIYSKNEEGNEYISGYERYKVYEAPNPQNKPTATKPKTVTPSQNESSVKEKQWYDDGFLEEDAGWLKMCSGVEFLGQKTQDMGKAITVAGASLVASSTFVDDEISAGTGFLIGEAMMGTGVAIGGAGTLVELVGTVGKAGVTGGGYNAGVATIATVAGEAAQKGAEKVGIMQPASGAIGDAVSTTIKEVAKSK